MARLTHRRPPGSVSAMAPQPLNQESSGVALACVSFFCHRAPSCYLALVWLGNYRLVLSYSPSPPQDMREEAGRHGLCNNVLIPRPTPENPNPPGMCKVGCMADGSSSAGWGRRSQNPSGRVVYMWGHTWHWLNQAVALRCCPLYGWALRMSSSATHQGIHDMDVGCVLLWWLGTFG